MEEKYINELINLSKKSFKKSEVPIAALIIDENGKIISKAYNTRNIKQQTINHAEILAITKANKKLKSWRLNKCTLYVTIEPCEMCKNVIKESRIDKVFYLVPRLKSKKIYNKTNFFQIEEKSNENSIDKYKKIIEKFWENKR